MAPYTVPYTAPYTGLKESSGGEPADHKRAEPLDRDRDETARDGVDVLGHLREPLEEEAHVIYGSVYGPYMVRITDSVISSSFFSISRTSSSFVA